MVVMNTNEAKLISNNPTETHQYGIQLGSMVRSGDVILLYGNLGAGKTHFTQGIAEGLGITGAVRSPTFTLVNEYQDGRLPLYHIDLYRLDGDGDIASIGLDEYFDEEGIVVIEWPEKGEAWLPADALHIHITYLSDKTRALELKTSGSHSTSLLNRYLAR